VQEWTHHAASSLITGEDGGGFSRSQREWWRAASKVRLTAQCVAWTAMVGGVLRSSLPVWIGLGGESATARLRTYICIPQASR
jgi:hypothetical protein